MNKKELMQNVAKDCNVAVTDVTYVVNSLVKVINEALLNGEEVKLSGLGVFEVNTKKEKKCVPPKQTEAIVIPAKRVVRFKASKQLKADLNND